MSEQEEQKRSPGGMISLWTPSFFLITAISFAAFTTFQMLMPTMPLYAKQLGGSDSAAGLVIGSFALASLLVRMGSGYLLDRYGRRLILLLGLLVFIASTLAYHLAATVAVLVMIRCLHGMGWGLTGTATSTVASDLIPPGRLSEGMGYFGLSSTLSLALAPMIGLWVVEYGGFPELFWLATVMSGVAFLLVFHVHFTYVPPVGAGSFAPYERSALPATGINLLLTLGYGAIVAFLALYAAERGMSNIGLFFSCYAAAVFVARLTTGKIGDTFGFDVLVIPGIASMAAGLVLLNFVQALQGVLVVGILYGAGFGVTLPCLQALAVRQAAPQRRGAANATFYTGFDMGIGLGAFLWGMVAEKVGYGLMFVGAALPTALAIVIYIGLRRRRILLP